MVRKERRRNTLKPGIRHRRYREPGGTFGWNIPRETHPGTERMSSPNKKIDQEAEGDFGTGLLIVGSGGTQLRIGRKFRGGPSAEMDESRQGPPKRSGN